MHNLIINLKKKLIIKREHEYKKLLEFDKNEHRDSIHIYTGKIIEIDNLIKIIDDMLLYNDNLSKQI